MERKAFTLVELIVVITILAILGTIAFISLQGYSSAARDSTRLSDIGSIKKTLELYALDTGKYPDPTEQVETITYSGSDVWMQGNFGDKTLRDTQKLSNVPVDPLTKTPYTYSLLNTKKEYELGMILEGELSKLELNKSNAEGNTIATSYVTGNYNGKVAKVEKNNESLIIAVPTLINANLGYKTYEEIITNQTLAYNGTNTLPASYTGTTLKVTGTNQQIINKDDILIFKGDLNSVNSKTFVENLQKAYSGTVSNGDEIQEILDINTSDTEEMDSFTNNTLSRLGSAVKTESSNTSEEPEEPKVFSKTILNYNNNLEQILNGTMSNNFTIQFKGITLDSGVNHILAAGAGANVLYLATTGDNIGELTLGVWGTGGQATGIKPTLGTKFDLYLQVRGANDWTIIAQNGSNIQTYNGTYTLSLGSYEYFMKYGTESAGNITADEINIINDGGSTDILSNF